MKEPFTDFDGEKRAIASNINIGRFDVFRTIQVRIKLDECYGMHDIYAHLRRYNLIPLGLKELRATIKKYEELLAASLILKPRGQKERQNKIKVGAKMETFDRVFSETFDVEGNRTGLPEATSRLYLGTTLCDLHPKLQTILEWHPVLENGLGCKFRPTVRTIFDSFGAKFFYSTVACKER